MNTITINWSHEDRLRIDRLVGLLESLVVAEEAKGTIARITVDEDLNISESTMGQANDTPAETPQNAPEPVEQVQTPPATENTQDEPQEAETVAPVPTVTKLDIQQKVIELVGKGKKAVVKDIITTYADSVSDLPESALVEVWDKLIALEG